MQTAVVKGRIATPEGVRPGALTIAEGRIARLDADDAAGKAYDFGDALVAPGFVDVHVHGVGPFGMAKIADILGAAEWLPRFGTVGFLPTVASLGKDGFARFCRNVREARDMARPGSARVLGAHCEGPFINPDRCGGMDPAVLRPPDAEEALFYIEESGGALNSMTLSPELPGAEDVIRLLAGRGVAVALGHSSADDACIERAVAAGARRICHLFNVFMRPSEFGQGAWTREAARAFLERRMLDAEVICDMRHVAPEDVRMAARALGPDRFIAITDAMQGAGLPPGEYRMADGRAYHTRDGVGRRVRDGTLVGSVLTMDRAFANLVGQCGASEADAVRYVSTNPSRAAGAVDAGSLEPGKRADIAVLDKDYRCVATFVGGEPAHLP